MCFGEPLDVPSGSLQKRKPLAKYTLKMLNVIPPLWCLTVHNSMLETLSCPALDDALELYLNYHPLLNGAKRRILFLHNIHETLNGTNIWESTLWKNFYGNVMTSLMSQLMQ